ncbi:MAG: hypothetical protein AB7F86_03710 [Bdellovibrionales bacterium]
MMNKAMSLKWRKVSLIIAGMIGLSTLSFNCAPGLFMGADYRYLNSSSSGGDLFSDIKDSPWVLLNTFQVFATFANVTGQNKSITNTQTQEYATRTGALSQTDKLTDINAPMQMAASSLAGEFCNGLIARESANGAAREFFVGVNFGANLANNSMASYSNAIGVMADKFYGRPLTGEEAGILTDYYNDFVSTAGNANNQTRNLYLSTCAGMLASFDAMTY